MKSDPKGLNVEAKITVIANADKVAISQIQVRHLSSGDRTQFAAKTLAMFWGGAIVCIFIPVMHFVLVPTGLLLGFVFAYRQLTFEEQMIAGELKCPDCLKAFPVEPGPFNWPKRLDCPHCQVRLYIEV